jgi:hypothetical protein
MHDFSLLVEGVAAFALDRVKATEEQIMERLQSSASSVYVKNLQSLKLYRAVVAVGMFSMFEAQLQRKLKTENGFSRLREVLANLGEKELLLKFKQFSNAINVLKHGQGRSYEALLEQRSKLPFELLPKDNAFFEEGDVSEVTTLIKVDDAFVNECASLIEEVNRTIFNKTGIL